MAIAFPATRWSLITRLPDQPHQATVLLGLYADAIGGYLAAKLVGERPDVIQDVVQEVLTDLLVRHEVLARASAGPGSRFRHYLMNLAWASARNALRRLRRGAGDRLAGDEAALSGAEAPEHPDQLLAMDRAWALSVIQEALADLRVAAAHGRVAPETWSVVQASLVEGRGLRDVAADFGLSLATASRRLGEGRAALHAGMVERLRAAGELAGDEDAVAAGEHLLALVRG